MGKRADEQIRRLLMVDDRPIVACVGMDVAGSTGTCGLSIVSMDGTYREHYAGGPLNVATFRWLGERVARMCEPATRVAFAAEGDAFGNGNGRKLGIGIGAIEGLLVDLNAITPNTRVDVSSVTWRAHCDIRKGTGRKEAKALAIQRAMEYGWTPVPIAADAAEALHIAEWLRWQLERVLGARP